jgi:putative sterol carrier protein
MMSAVEPIDIDVDAWAKAWAEDLNANDAYKDVGKGWKSPIVFIVTAKPDAGLPEDIGMYLDLYDGECREARQATDTDVKKAPFVLKIKPEVAKAIFDGRLDPEDALMLGKVEIVRGSKAKLSAYAEASREMFEVAKKSAERLDIQLPDIPGDF